MWARSCDVHCAKPERRALGRRLPALVAVALFAAWLATGVAHGAGLEPFTHVYRGKISFVPVEAAVTLERDDDGWRFDSVSRTRGWAAWKKGEIEESSRFELTGEGVRPLTYRKLDGFSDRDRDVETRFARGEVSSLYRGGTIVHSGQDGPVYDLLSLRLALRLDLARGRLAERYEVVDGRGRLRTITISRHGAEAISTGFGRIEAQRLEYSTRSDRRYVVWFAPELDHVLVRLEEHRDGRLRAWLTLSSRTDEAKRRRGTRPQSDEP
jgi:hypothetical protein